MTKVNDELKKLSLKIAGFVTSQNTASATDVTASDASETAFKAE